MLRPRHDENVVCVLQNFVSVAEQVLKSCLHFYRATFFWFALVLRAAVTDSGSTGMALVSRIFKIGPFRLDC